MVDTWNAVPSISRHVCLFLRSRQFTKTASPFLSEPADAFPLFSLLRPLLLFSETRFCLLPIFFPLGTALIFASSFLPRRTVCKLCRLSLPSMEVPVGFLATLWSFVSFLPFFFMLLILGIIKAAIIGPFAAVIVFVGNSAVIVGLWPAHFVWSYYCVAKTKRLGLILKILLLVTMPVPLVLLPVLGVVGSLLVGVGYGFFAPLIATFEGGGEQVIDKISHYFLDGCWSTIEGSCTIVCDVIDFCFHSYFSFMDELSEAVPVDEKPVDIKLLMLPSCFLVGLLSVLIDVPTITAVALWKSPYMLFKGWKRLFEDLIGREGPFLETVCVPFAGLAIILWPIAVVGAVICAFICSFFLGLYGAVVVHQESSLKMGLAYIISIISVFDEYTNDLLYMREGSYLPRYHYPVH